VLGYPFLPPFFGPVLVLILLFEEIADDIDVLAPIPGLGTSEGLHILMKGTCGGRRDGGREGG